METVRSTFAEPAPGQRLVLEQCRPGLTIIWRGKSAVVERVELSDDDYWSGRVLFRTADGAKHLLYRSHFQGLEPVLAGGAS